MTAERYFNLCEQLNQEPVESEIPPDWGDLPEIVQIALNMYSRLGDRLVAELGFVGKDYSLLETLLKQEGLHPSDEELVVEVITWLENRQIKRSADHLKKEHEKMKRKNQGPKRLNP